MMGPSKWQPYNLSTPLDPEIIQDSGCIKYCSYKPLNIQPKSVTFLAARALEFDFKIKKICILSYLNPHRCYTSV